MASSQRPRAIRIPRVDGLAEVDTPAPDAVRLVDEPYEIVDAADGVQVPVAPRRRAPWLSVLLAALSGLVSIAVGLSIERLIADLFASAPWLGWVSR